MIINLIYHIELGKNTKVVRTVNREGQARVLGYKQVWNFVASWKEIQRKYTWNAPKAKQRYRGKCNRGIAGKIRVIF